MARAIFAARALLVVGAALVCIVSPLCNARQKQPEAYQERLVEWILEDPDGFVHPAIQFQRLGPQGKSGSYAMHATEDIPKGTPLIVLPRKYLIESHMDKPKESESGTDDYRMCVTVEKMLDEYTRHTDPKTTFVSFYAPYLSYLFEDTSGGTMRGLLPGTWSEHSKWLVYLILGSDDNDWAVLRPFELEYSSIYDICEGNVDNGEEDINFTQGGILTREGDSENDVFANEQMAEDTYIFLLSRGWYDKLLPLVDMLNHRNGPSRNVEVTPVDDIRGEDVAVYAWKDIKKGEQLQYTYTECMDETCEYGGLKYYATSQFMFVEYGFVEGYPRRWAFDILNEEEDGYEHLYCEITTDPNDDTKLVFQWVFKAPTKRSILWMREQLDRLKAIEGLMKEGLEELESAFGTETIHNLEYERETIVEYYEAYIEAFELALDHKDDPVGVTDESFLQELSELKQSIGKDTKTMDEIRMHGLLSTAHDSQPNTDERTNRGATTNANLESDEL